MPLPGRRHFINKVFDGRAVALFAVVTVWAEFLDYKSLLIFDHGDGNHRQS